jgi:crossover junction endodeoxyribonuclease RuvC
MTTVLGIDPGLDGAIAVLTVGGELLAVHDMPTILGEGAKNRRSICPALLAAIISNVGARRAYCELIGPRPTDGVVGAFSFGRSRGQIEGVAAALQLPIEMIAPPTWKRLSDIPPGKEHKDIARSRACARWPGQAELFAKKCHVDRAEAALIGMAGLMREGR